MRSMEVQKTLEALSVRKNDGDFPILFVCISFVTPSFAMFLMSDHNL